MAAASKPALLAWQGATRKQLFVRTKCSVGDMR